MRAAMRTAALLALLTLAGCIGWAGESDEPVPRVEVSLGPTTTTDPGQQPIAVYKVASDIPQGTTAELAITKRLIVESEITRDFLPATYVRDLSSLEGLIATEDLTVNQVLVEAMFGEP